MTTSALIIHNVLCKVYTTFNFTVISKLSLFFILFTSLSCFVSAQKCNCKHVITADQLYVDATKMDVQPGDTVCIEAGIKKSLMISNFHGTADEYIVFTNCGGEVLIQNNDVSYGVCIYNSSYFRFTGTGTKGVDYGVRIMETMVGSSIGFKISNGSTNYEIDHIEVSKSGFAGIMAKTDPKIDLTTNRNNFTQYQTIIHDNYFHNTGGVGMYIGHSYYNGILTKSDDNEVLLFPSVLKGVRIYNNRVDSTGWDGLQVGSATQDCEIYGNTVTNYGLSAISSQQSGIQIGGGTTGKCYNNYVANGTGNGMSIFGLGNNDIYNNIIINAGRTYFPNDPAKRIHGIFVDDRATISGSSFNFYNNTIVSPKTDGIRFSSVLSRNNRFINNIIINPGSLMFYSKYSKETPYINTGGKTGVDAVISNNFFDLNTEKIQFEDDYNNNFKLSETSPAIEAGLDLSNYGINFDFENNARPLGRSYDLGAYQRIANTETKLKSISTANYAVYPNPCNGKFQISRDETSNVNVTIYNISGKIVKTSKNNSDKNLQFDISDLASKGKYFVTLSDENGSSTITIVVL